MRKFCKEGMVVGYTVIVMSSLAYFVWNVTWAYIPVFIGGLITLLSLPDDVHW